MSELTLLGTGTCQVEAERRASSVLIRLDETAILFDCGHGILQRLLEAGVRHDQLQHVVLSHFHPDHISDLISLMHAGAWSQRDPRTSDLHIYGPQGVYDLIIGIFQLLGPNSFQQPYYQVHIHEITEPRFTIADYPFEFEPAASRESWPALVMERQTLCHHRRLKLPSGRARLPHRRRHGDHRCRPYQ